MDSVDSFKNKLDKFWSNQDMLFDYKVDLTTICNRSLSNMDDQHCSINTHTYITFFCYLIGTEASACTLISALLCFSLTV